MAENSKPTIDPVNESRGLMRYEEMMARERSRQFSRVGIKPNDIFLLARDNPIVQHLVDKWKFGHVSWEAALMLMVRELVNQNDSLMKTAAKSMFEAPGPVFVPKPVTPAEIDPTKEGAPEAKLIRFELDAPLNFRSYSVTVPVRVDELPVPEANHPSEAREPESSWRDRPSLL